MAPQKNCKLLTYEHIIYHFKSHDLEIPFYKLFCEIFKFHGSMNKKRDYGKKLKRFIKLGNLDISQK